MDLLFSRWFETKSLEEERSSFIVKVVINTERGVWRCKVLS